MYFQINGSENTKIEKLKISSKICVFAGIYINTGICICIECCNRLKFHIYAYIYN